MKRTSTFSKRLLGASKKYLGIALTFLMIIGVLCAMAVSASAAEVYEGGLISQGTTVDIPVVYEKSGGIYYMKAYADAAGNIYSGEYTAETDTTLTLNSYEIHVYSAEQILGGAAPHSGYMDVASEVVSDATGTWFKASKTGPAYNACFRFTLPESIKADAFEKVALEYRSTFQNNLNSDVNFQFHLPISTGYSYNPAGTDPVCKSEKKYNHTSSGVIDVDTVDIDTSKLSVLTNDKVGGVQYVNRLKIFPWNMGMSTAGECVFEIRWLAVFSDDGLADHFDFDEYKAQTMIKIPVTVKIDGATVQLGNEYEGYKMELPAPELAANEVFVGYLDASDAFVTSTIATTEVREFTTLKRLKVNADDFTTARGNLGNIKAAAADGTLSIAYLGGSITQGAGSNTGMAGAYAGRVTAALAEIFDAEITPYYMGLGGTGSRLGSHRLADNIIANRPDIVIVEFAVNDGYCGEFSGNTYTGGIYYEYILRRIREKLPKTEILSIYTTNRGIANDPTYGAENTSKAAGKQAEIAAHYDATSIDVGRYLLNSIKNANGFNSIWSYYYADEVHPTDLGHSLYAEAIAAYLEKAADTNQAPAAHTLPATTLYGADEFMPKTIDLQDVTLVSGFKYDADLKEGNGYKGKIVPVSGASSYKVEFDFVGTELSIYMNSPQGVNMTVAIDGKTPITESGTAQSNGPKKFYQDLPYGKYHATVTYSGMPTANGNIIAICVGGVRSDGTGDPDGDGEITPVDATILARAIAGWVGNDYDGVVENTQFMDINGDNKVSALDLVAIVRHLAGWKGYEMLPLEG